MVLSNPVSLFMGESAHLFDVPQAARRISFGLFFLCLRFGVTGYFRG